MRPSGVTAVTYLSKHCVPDYLIFCLFHPLTGNYYGTPRPVHIGPESPPITYQEHRNLLRNFRTRSKSLSNLEKAVEEGDNSEEDSGLSGRHTEFMLHTHTSIHIHIHIHVLSLYQQAQLEPRPTPCLSTSHGRRRWGVGRHWRTEEEEEEQGEEEEQEERVVPCLKTGSWPTVIQESRTTSSQCLCHWSLIDSNINSQLN